MPLDADLKALLDEELKLPPIQTLPIDLVRQGSLNRWIGFQPSGPQPETRDLAIPTAAGDLRARLYTPPGNGRHPLMVFFHGGGFVICAIETHDNLCRELSMGARCAVLSVDYRLAPEHRFPAAADDCYQTVLWAATNAPALGADLSRLVIAGDSAGGNLAAVTAIRLRDEGGPKAVAQVLIYPVTDYYLPGTPSYDAYSEGYGVTKEGMAWFWDHYLPDPKMASNWMVSPLRARDLAHLPAALVLTAEYDVLRDEGEQYAERMRAAGVPVTLRRYGGMNHGFIMRTAAVAKARRAVEETCAWLRQRLDIEKV
jgi:acetyl esterase